MKRLTELYALWYHYKDTASTAYNGENRLICLTSYILGFEEGLKASKEDIINAKKEALATYKSMDSIDLLMIKNTIK